MRRSQPGLDACRGLAVVLMYVVHARRLQVDNAADEGSLAEATLRFFMWSEPFIAACFLFIVGFSLVLSHAKHSRQPGWLRKVLLRAAQLYALSVLLFVPHYGLQFPDLIVSSGILSAIALAIALVGLALAAPRPGYSLSLLAIVVLVTTELLDQLGMSIPGVNAGPGGAFPLVGFSAAGALTALIQKRAGTRGILILALVAGAPFVAALLSGRPWLTHHTSVYADYGGQLPLAELFGATPTASVEVRFWNHSACGALGLLLPLGVTLTMFLAPQHTIGDSLPVRPLQLLGRHALAAYVGHLMLLGLLELTGLVPSSAVWTWVLIAALAVGATLAAAALELARQRRQPRAPAVPARQAHDTASNLDG